jgi:hypothetical protein
MAPLADQVADNVRGVSVPKASALRMLSRNAHPQGPLQACFSRAQAARTCSGSARALLLAVLTVLLLLLQVAGYFRP